MKLYANVIICAFLNIEMLEEEKECCYELNSTYAFFRKGGYSLMHLIDSP